MTRAGAQPVRKRSASLSSAALVSALSCVSVLSHAQVTTTPGGASANPVAPTLREIEEQQKALPRTPDRAIEPDKRRAVKPVPGLKTDVKAFRFSGLTVVREDELQG